jgi:hypothetical protein
MDVEPPSGIFFYFIVFVMIVGQATQNVSAPLWYGRLDHTNWTSHPSKNHSGQHDVVSNRGGCADAYVMYLIMIIWYPVLFFFTAIGFNLKAGKKPFSFLWRWNTWGEHWTIIKTGLCDALNGALVIPASPSSRTPPVVASLISATTLLPLILIKHYYFGIRNAREHYFSANFAVVMVLYVCAAYTGKWEV